jgi:hypothetical protein
LWRLTGIVWRFEEREVKVSEGENFIKKRGNLVCFYSQIQNDALFTKDYASRVAFQKFDKQQKRLQKGQFPAFIGGFFNLTLFMDSWFFSFEE